MLTRSLISKFVGDIASPPTPADRGKIGALEAWISIIVNALLVAVKGWLGVAIGSLSLLADAVHSLSDIATSAVVLFGFKISGKPADKEHPFGHGRAEYVATLVIAVMLAVVGFEFIKSAVGRLSSPAPIVAGWDILAIIGATIVIKFWLSQFSGALAQAINSSTLHADAWHHRSDAFSSILVLMAVAGSAQGYPILDGIGGIIVGLYMIATGYQLAREVIDPLLGAPPSPELVQQIRDLCKAHRSVYDAHDIIVHNYGQYQFFSIHVEVDSDLTATEGHDVAEDLAASIKTTLGAYATIHIDPLDTHNEAVQEVATFLDGLVQSSADIAGYHDLRVVNSPKHKAILLDVDMRAGASKGRRQQTRKWLEQELETAFAGNEINITLSPLHTFR